MKYFSIISFLFLALNSASGQKIISNVEEIFWGSVSDQGPNWGFYGQEFEVKEDSKLLGISVYIYDHWGHDETKASINFAVWGYDERPTSTILVSEAQKVEENHVGSWMEYELKSPLELKAGKYLFAVGQSKVQGFIAFGQTKRKEGYTSKGWMKAPLPGISDGKQWFTFRELFEKMGSEISDQKVDIESLEKTVVMMKIKLAN